MDVEMPDGVIITDVPEGTTQAELMARYKARVSAPKAAPAAGPPPTQSVDDILGPAAGPPVTPHTGDNGVPLPEGATATWRTVPPHNDPVQDSMVDRSPVGRVLDAFGQGFKNQFGSQPVFSPETEAAMKSAKMDTSPIGTIRRSFNEVLFRPAAYALDGLWRGTMALPGAAGRATGQVMNELGVTKLVGVSDEKARDDWEGMGALAPAALGMANDLGVLVKTPEAPKPGAPATENLGTAEGAAMATSEGLKTEPQLAHTPFPKKAGNINLSRINAPEDVLNVIRQTAADNSDFLDARRGSMSLADTEQLADALGMSSQDLLSRKVGDAFNAEQAVAARNLLERSATDVRDLAVKAASGSEKDLAAFQEAAVRHSAIQEQVSGMTAEAGRALSSFRIMAGEGGDLAKVIEAFGGEGRVKDLADKITKLDTPEKVSKFLMRARKATTGDMVVEAWVNGLLSGPSTHIVNTVSNLTTALWNVPETAVAAGIGKLRQVAGDSGPRVRFGEAGQELFGIVQGSKDGLVAATKAYTEGGVIGHKKIELGHVAAIPSKVFREGVQKKTVAWTNPFTGAAHETPIPFTGEVELGGKQVRLAGRLLSASDEYFKAIGARQALNRLAYRQASEEGLTGQAHSARVANLTEHPTDEMVAYARDQAEYQTFTNPLGEFGSALQQVQQSNKAARVVLTFVRTPLNIAKYGVRDRTLLGVFSKEIRQNLTSADPIVRDTTIARLSLGTAASISAVALAAEGLITGGGPSDAKERAALYATGWQPYSAKIGDMYFSYGRVEPLATLLGLAADMYDKADTVDGIDTAAGLVVASLATNLAAKTSLTGLTDLVQAVEDPDRYGKQYVSKLLATAVPNVLAQTARMEDPYMREARALVDQIKARVPGLSESVMPRLDIWGQPIPNQGVGAMTGIYASRVEHDPVNQELIALGVFPGRPQRTIRGVELSPDQYQEYQLVAGRLAKMQLDAMVGNPSWRSMPEFARVEVVQNTIRHSRAVAASLMQVRHPELIRAGIQARINQIRGRAH